MRTEIDVAAQVAAAMRAMLAAEPPAQEPVAAPPAQTPAEAPPSEPLPDMIRQATASVVDELLTPTEAAAALGLNYATVTRWIRDGQLPTVGRHGLIHPVDLAAVPDSRRGRPRGRKTSPEAKARVAEQRAARKAIEAPGGQA